MKKSGKNVKNFIASFFGKLPEGFSGKHVDIGKFAETLDKFDVSINPGEKLNWILRIIEKNFLFSDTSLSSRSFSNKDENSKIILDGIANLYNEIFYGNYKGIPRTEQSRYKYLLEVNKKLFGENSSFRDLFIQANNGILVSNNLTVYPIKSFKCEKNGEECQPSLFVSENNEKIEKNEESNFLLTRPLKEVSEQIQTWDVKTAPDKKLNLLREYIQKDIGTDLSSISNYVKDLENKWKNQDLQSLARTLVILYNEVLLCHCPEQFKYDNNSQSYCLKNCENPTTLNKIKQWYSTLADVYELSWGIFLVDCQYNNFHSINVKSLSLNEVKIKLICANPQIVNKIIEPRPDPDKVTQEYGRQIKIFKQQHPEK